MDGATVSLFLATFAAAFVEGVETLTIVLAMGVSRDWRSTWAGVTAGLVALVGFTVVAGYAVATWLPEAVLQLVVGTLLLVFGLQWLRKAVLRTSGRKALADEDAEFRDLSAAGRRTVTRRRWGVDVFAFVVTLKAVFLEGVEVVFIVVTFGLSADDLPTAVTAAGVATVVVAGAGVALRRPLARVPENTLKYVVGLLLATFGTYWAVQGVGILLPDREVLAWPGDDLALLALLAAWFLVSRALVVLLRRDPPSGGRGPTDGQRSADAGPAVAAP
jgi:Ca2+/H+ antiporter, TMEM165/GDT1 family